MPSRRAVLARATKLGIEIEIEGSRGRIRHVHAYAPKGYIFVGSGCSNAGCGNYETSAEIDWAFVAEEIKLVEERL